MKGSIKRKNQLTKYIMKFKNQKLMKYKKRFIKNDDFSLDKTLISIINFSFI